jgi:hypothetical protein
VQIDAAEGVDVAVRLPDVAKLDQMLGHGRLPDGMPAGIFPAGCCV